MFEEFLKAGIKPGLGRMEKAVRLLGHPERNINVVLVGGTNGKGSVTTYVSACLSKEYKVGSYFSPHLVDTTERIKINGRDISKRRIGEYEQMMKKIAKRVPGLTYFEALTASAFKYFYDEEVEWAVMEVGMGGRYDATNIANEKLSIITNVTKDHTKWLGNTIKKIAREKAGIIKSGVGITGAKGEALKEIKSIAKNRRKRLDVLNEDFFMDVLTVNENGSLSNYRGEGIYNKLRVKLLGTFQPENAALAVRACELIGLDEENIRDGLKESYIKGRMEVLSRKPLILADAAHNVDCIRRLEESLGIFKRKRTIVVTGMMKDKDVKKMVKELDEVADVFIFNKPKIERAADPRILKNYAMRCEKNIVVEDVKQSVALAKKIATSRDLILITGSIYMLSEVYGGRAVGQ